MIFHRRWYFASSFCSLPLSIVISTSAEKGNLSRVHTGLFRGQFCRDDGKIVSSKCNHRWHLDFDKWTFWGLLIEFGCTGWLKENFKMYGGPKLYWKCCLVVMVAIHVCIFFVNLNPTQPASVRKPTSQHPALGCNDVYLYPHGFFP
jgi:hypothetical protein